MKAIIKQSVKRILLRVLPGPARALQATRQRSYVRGFERRLGLPRIHRAFLDRHGPIVESGPFRGMSYVSQAVGSALVPKLLGCYEAELHDTLARILAREAYCPVVDVGCAEGYYAVGLALRLLSARVYAFDTDPQARRLCQAMARANNVADRVIVQGRCDADQLNRLLGPEPGQQRALIVCDCEGFEIELLCPERAPGLRRADLLVELHEHMRPGLSETVLARFRATHEIYVIPRADRDASQYPALRFLEEQERRLAVCEFRPEDQQWAFLTPRRDPGATAAG